MSLAVTVDPTGTIATVSGSGGASVSLYAVRVTGDTWPPTVWQLLGTQVGDGQFTPLGLIPGSYFIYGQSVSAVSPPTFFTVPSTNLAPATACRQAIVDRLTLLALPGLQAIYEDIWPDPANHTFPCVILSVDGLQEREESGLDTLDLIGHPTRLVIADRLQRRDTQLLVSQYEPWRQRISDAFRWQRLPGITGYNHTTVETLDIADPRLPSYQYTISGLILWSWVYHTRGV